MAKAKKSKRKAPRRIKIPKVKISKKQIKRVQKIAKRVAGKAMKVATRAAKTAVREAVRQAPPKIVKQVVSTVNRALAPAGFKLVSNKKLLGEVSHFFDKISVAVIEVKAPMKAGDRISIEGPQTNFTQTVNSMQIEHDKIQAARAGQSVGMKVSQPVRKKDLVYLA